MGARMELQEHGFESRPGEHKCDALALPLDAINAAAAALPKNHPRWHQNKSGTHFNSDAMPFDAGTIPPLWFQG